MSSMNDASANERSVRSTMTSALLTSAREKARRRRDCVARTSSPLQRRTGGLSSNWTIPGRYPMDRAARQET
jgi:hypothetical protein